MGGLQGIFSSLGSSSFGLNGFLNGAALGNSQTQSSQSSNGLTNTSGQSLAQRLGLHLSPQTTNNNLLDSISSPKKVTNSNDTHKNDRYESSDDQTNGTSGSTGLTNGTTQQIVVGQDGRYETSLDLQINADGSYQMNLSVHLAQSQAAALSQSSQSSLTAQSTSDTTQTGDADSDSDSSTDSETDPDSLNSQGANILYQRYTSYQQDLQTNGFQAQIFMEEAKSVGYTVQQAYGQGMSDQYMSVAGQVANEFTLNISISGDDLSNFNQVAQDLSQFDDSGTLSGFLSAVQGVLTTDPSNLSGLVDVTQNLVSATQEHVSGQLNNFFGSLQDQYGESLEDLGFDSNYFQNLGQDVQGDLNQFFQATNNLLGSLTSNLGTTGTSSSLDQTSDPTSQQIDALDQLLEKMREQRQELLNRNDEITIPASLNQGIDPTPDVSATSTNGRINVAA